MPISIIAVEDGEDVGSNQSIDALINMRDVVRVGGCDRIYSPIVNTEAEGTVFTRCKDDRGGPFRIRRLDEAGIYYSSNFATFSFSLSGGGVVCQLENGNCVGFEFYPVFSRQDASEMSIPHTVGGG